MAQAPRCAAVPGLKPPPALVIDHRTVQEEWRHWKRQWQDYCVVQGFAADTPEFQLSVPTGHWT